LLSTARRPRFRRLLSLLGTLLILGGLLPVAAASPVLAISPNVVISEVYGGGGNTGSVYDHDYIELYNRGSSPVALGGNSVQYTGATSTSNFGSSSNLRTELPAFTLNPGQHFLIQEGTNNGDGVPLPTPDYIDTDGAIAMALAAGKVVYVTGTAPLGCNGSTDPCDADQLARIVDLVGYGTTATFYEGAGPTGNTSNTTAAIRGAGGATDTDNNNLDFAIAAPDPDNSVELPPSVSATSPVDGATNVSISADVTIEFSEPVNVTNPWFTIVCGTSGGHTAAVTGGPTTFTLNPDVDFANSESCTVTVDDQAVSDQDSDDPPDTMLADYVFSFATVPPPTADDAPAVSSTTPANGATGVAISANVSITFSEPVNVVSSWFTIACASSGLHAAVASGGPTTFSLDPAANFVFGELCTTTVTHTGVTDQDANDPPDEMAADYVFSFTIANLAVVTLPYAQAWTNTAAITGNDDWSGVPGVAGFLGQDITTATGADPQTLLTTSALGGDVDVIANQTNTAITNGGVAEFEIANPVVALQGSGTADAPYLLFNFSTSGISDITVAYNLRDIDGSADNAVQPVALQYRVGSTGNFTNIPIAFVADATTGPSLATQVTAVSATLPAAANNQPIVQVRIITSNAVGNDEWVGIDDISIATVVGDVAPSVTSTTPPNGASNVALDASPSITFSEPVSVTGAWFDLTCATSGTHTAVVGGGPTTFTIDPDINFAVDELCTLTINKANVTDVDTNDPPDEMAANVVVTFRTVGPTVFIHDVQAATHISPFSGQSVVVAGVVTAKRLNGFYIQDPSPDANDATSEAILVFTSVPPASVNVGDSVSVAGVVTEFRAGGAASTNLTTTEITAPSISVISTGNALPAAIVLGTGGRIPPNTVIEDDATGDVETSGVFDPASDGIDFFETLEAMRVQINNPVVVGPRNSFGEIFVLGDDGANASVRTVRGGIVIQATDFNPERIQFDDAVLLAFTPSASTPNASVGDHFTTAAVGVVDYDFGNFEVELTSALTTVPGGLARESTDPAAPSELSVATFNVENLDANEPQSKFNDLAAMIVNNLKAPDVIALEEIQDNNGATNDAVTDADLTLNKLRDAIATAGGPTYDWRQINPVDDQDGGEPGGNIRVGFMFRTDRGLAFVDRPGGTPTAPTTIVGSPGAPELSYSPGRVDPTNTAWNASRKPLAGEFTFGGQKFFLIANHFNSKGGDQPLFGHFQPPARSSEVQRHQQAQIVNNFVDSILALDAKAKIIVLGDINDFEFSTTMSILKGNVLHDLMDSLPQAERYSYVFEGNSQVLDHIVVSDDLFSNTPFEFDPVHANAEFFDQISDHDPSVSRFVVATPGTVTINKTGINGAPLSGAGFTLYVDAAPTGGTRGAEDTTAAGGCTTSANGTCSITSVPLGTYWLVETTTPNGYATVDPTQIVVGAGPSPGVGDTDIVNLNDQAVPGTVTVNKTGRGGTALSDAEFTLFVDAAPTGGSRGAEDNTAAGDCMTNGAGTCSITDVPLGQYWLVETETPAGYATVNPTAVTVGLGPSAGVGDTDTFNLTDQPVPGTVTINKTGQGGTALSGLHRRGPDRRRARRGGRHRGRRLHDERFRNLLDHERCARPILAGRDDHAQRLRHRQPDPGHGRPRAVRRGGGHGHDQRSRPAGPGHSRRQ
jgi:predicted extracellular nuclease/methionine-rich copper-binding protein CopC